MKLLIAMDSMMQCTFGTATSKLVVEPKALVNSETMPAATIMDHKSGSNIPGFGLCISIANPAVLAAKMPMPCIPVTNSPWKPGAIGITIKNKVALDSKSTCACAWAGTIKFTKPNSVKTKISKG